MMIQEAFVDDTNQDQTAQKMQSGLWSTLSTIFILDYNKTFPHLAMECIFSQWKNLDLFIW